MTRRILSAGPTLIFGGAYSNLEAMLAVLQEARRRKIPADRIICTGDLAAYGADPLACITLARDTGIHVVMGNCDEQLSHDADNCGCGFAPGSTCEQFAELWYAYARRALNDDTRQYLTSLPKQLDLQLGKFRLAVVHGSLNAINRFVFPSTPWRIKSHDLAACGADGIIAGHSGLPFTQSEAGRFWHNPGALGLPANDGTPRVWCSVLTPADEGLTIEHVPLTYDHQTAARKMRDADLPEQYAAALSTGICPTCDTLPTAELKIVGRPYQATALRLRMDEDITWPMTEKPARLSAQKFGDPARTAAGEPRATVALQKLSTLWINTGTLCNLACASCYIESTPRNDRLGYISTAEVETFLDEIETAGLGTKQVGFTGGEPFMNPEFMSMLESTLRRGFDVLVLTNAMKPMHHHRQALVRLRETYGQRLTLRVSLDHYSCDLHELERGPRSWQPTIDGLIWLATNGFRVAVAGRLYSGETEPIIRAGYAALFAELSLGIDASDPGALVLFPEMDGSIDVPEITEACWGILGKSPSDVMCASSRMVVKRKEASAPTVLACTLIAYDERFDLGRTLAEAAGSVALNHPHCAKFCVLGGAACSR